MEAILGAIGERALASLTAREAVAVVGVSRSAFAALPTIASMCWAFSPARQVGEPQIGVCALTHALASLPGGPSHVRSWPVWSTANANRVTRVAFCCWPLARMALKRQHVVVLCGASLENAFDGVLCLWMQSRLVRQNICGGRIVKQEVDLFGVISGGGFLLLRHHLLILDGECEHAPQAIVAPDWLSLVDFLRITAPRWLQEMEEAVGIVGREEPLASGQQPPCSRESSGTSLESHSDDSSDDETERSSSWTVDGTAARVSILCTEPLLETADAFLASAGIQQLMHRTCDN